MGLKSFAPIFRLIPAGLAALALSACVTLGGAGGSTDTASAEAAADTPNAAARTPTYAPQSSGSMLEVEPLGFDPATMPRACVNDLRLYRTYLQMPGATRMDLSKPVVSYIQEAGGAQAALETVNQRINELNDQLRVEVARRDPFNEQARQRSDDTIATLEDRILLNQALADALACRGGV